MFNNTPTRKIKKGKFDLTHEVKFTCEMGQLIPILAEEVLPGDKWSGYTQALVKLMPLLAPIMHNVDVYTRMFYVPNRLLWNNWESFITGGKDNSDNSIMPYRNITNAPIRSLEDYFGIPTEITNTLKVSALPFRAYNLIYNEYFLDQNLQDPLPLSLEDGEDTTEFQLQNVNWEKDYFTSANASPQAGTGVVMPLGTKAPVVGNGKTLGLTDGTNKYGLASGHTANWATGYQGAYGATPGIDPGTGGQLPSSRALGITNEPENSGMEVDLTQAESPSINALRNAFKVQGFLEMLNRVGFHMVDYLRGFWNVHASDARLQRPEYLGGGRTPIIISEVLQTSSSNSTSPQGNPSGHGISASGSNKWHKYFEEHGWVIGLLYIKPRTQYSQGLAKKWFRETKFDFALPNFQNLGEEAILKKEIYAQGTSDDNETWGYTARYQEYKSIENRIAGDFKKTLKYWTMAREFENEPQLNEDFIKCNPTKRIYATEGESIEENHVLIDLVNVISAIRPLEKYVTPASLN